ncbi:hypothetical protein [Paraglaciecola sp. 2405UD69-4]|uniref:hypothetical protein n=1 Tax=Paraglaciecola sp. 2405UD69-4 TaxID=3391836 RepID=UPI0039C8C454
MKTFELPKSISSLTEKLQIVQMSWQGVTVQLPKFAVYAIISQPVFDRVVFRHGRKIALINLGRYQIPILDPFRGDISIGSRYAIIISHARGNKFGLYGYPADHIDTDIQVVTHHKAVPQIVKGYL